MLVLSRKCGEEIKIGNDVVIRVVRTQGGRVQIGVSAPQHVTIRRSECVNAGRDEILIAADCG